MIWPESLIRRVLSRDRRFGFLKMYAVIQLGLLAAAAAAALLLPAGWSTAAIVMSWLTATYVWLRVRAEPYRYVVPLNIEMGRHVGDAEFLSRPDNLREYPLLGNGLVGLVVAGREMKKPKRGRSG